MDRIEPRDVRYIKLGRGGHREQQCIEEDNVLWIRYKEVPHDLCLAGDWEAVKSFLIDEREITQGVAANHVRQICDFYQCDEDVLWITFYKNRLWWCFSKPSITPLPGGSKIRPVIGRWRSTDIAGNPLDKGRLSGKLLAVERYPGAICSVSVSEYLVRKINAETSPVEQAALDAREELAQAIVAIIRRLPWKEFELLIDLIFRQAGWRRIGTLGKSQKTLDLDLDSPITQERYLVQIKSEAGRLEFEKFQAETEGMQEYRRYYFVVHSPRSGLTDDLATDTHKVWLSHHVAEFVIQYGLVDWVITKAI